MGSKRRVRRKSCTGKVKHADEDKAKAHALSLLRRDGRPRNVYHCRYCGQWHVGRRKKSRARKRQKW